MSQARRELRFTVIWILEASRGGPMRARILTILRRQPSNPHQLARELGVNYRTVLHHLRVLEENGLVERLGQGYGRPYVLTIEAEQAWSIIENSIKRVLGDR